MIQNVGQIGGWDQGWLVLGEFSDVLQIIRLLTLFSSEQLHMCCHCAGWNIQKGGGGGKEGAAQLNMAFLLLFLAAMSACSSGELVSGEVMAEFDQTGCLELANFKILMLTGQLRKKCHLLNLILYQYQTKRRPRKKMFSFGHCPDTRGALPEFFGPFLPCNSP